MAEKGKAWWLVRAYLLLERELLADREPLEMWAYRKPGGNRALREVTAVQSAAVLPRRRVEV